MKIVINKSHGSFALSEQALAQYASRKGIKLYTDNTLQFGVATYYTVPVSDYYAIYDKCKINHDYTEVNKVTFSFHSIDRDDEMLVAVVIELGNAASGPHAKLVVIEIPDDVDWEIKNDNGSETIHEKHRIWG